MYRSNITQELGGMPAKQALREFIKTALFFYQVANEEILADSLIKEGSRCIDEGKLTDALHLFEEANLLEKWRDIYGTIILANLAYICAKQGNIHKARDYVDDYYDLYGKSDYSQEPDEFQKLTYAQQEIDRLELQQMLMGNEAKNQ